MSGREVQEYTNLSDLKDKKWGKGKNKMDDENITFQRMVAKVAGDGGGYLRGRGVYEAEEDAERFLCELRNVHLLHLNLRLMPKGVQQQDKDGSPSKQNDAQEETKVENPVKSLLGLAYENSDEED